MFDAHTLSTILVRHFPDAKPADIGDALETGSAQKPMGANE
jgi:hypothetical protein